MRAFLRLFYESSNINHVNKISNLIVDSVNKVHGCDKFTGPVPYWKIDGSYELTFSFEDITRERFNFIKDALSLTWIYLRENEVVWNVRSEDCSAASIHETITWAHLELMEN